MNGHQRTRRTPLAVNPLEDRSVPSAAGIQVDPGAYEADSILVRLKADAPRVLAAVAPGVDLDRPLALVNGLWESRLAAGVDVATALTAARANPFVEYAEPNYVLHLATAPTDPKYTDGSLWGLHNTGQVVGTSTGTPDADIDAPEAWNLLPVAPASVIVAVIDTGVDYNHPDLNDNMWQNLVEKNGLPGQDDDLNGIVDDIFGADFVNNDGNPFDDNDHGTHVAGTIGAEWNNIGVAGVAPTARIMALKVFDSSGRGAVSDAIDGLYYAVANGARVSNHSYTFSAFSQPFLDAVTAAGQAGHLIAAAAGNGNFFGQAVNIDTSPTYPASYAPAVDNVLSVAATNNKDAFASWSNYGAKNVDLAAPGVDVYSTLPGNAYAYFSGTSMATPHVTGAAALLWSADPGLTMTEVRNQLLGGADYIGNLNPTRSTVTNGRLNVANSIPTAPGLPRLTISDAVVSEGNAGTTDAMFTVTLSVASLVTVTVNWATANQSATAGSDYVAVPVTPLTFEAGEVSKTVQVKVNGDVGYEPNETFAVRLTRATNAVVTDWVGIGTIANDDTASTVSINDVSGLEGRSGQRTFTFTVTLSGPSNVPITVNYATVNGTATTANKDYAARSGSLTFNAGETSKTIAVSVYGDRTREPNETFFVNLTGATNAAIADDQGVGTILNDDN